MFKIEFASPAVKFLRNVDKLLEKRILTKIEKLKEFPFPSDTKRVVGCKEKVFRIRVGDYRILYVVFLKEKIILISDIDKRSRIY